MISKDSEVALEVRLEELEMNKCLLCLNITFQKNIIALNQRQECGTTTEEIIKLHFWFANQIFESAKSERKPGVLCRTCWEKLENFHEFFCAIKSNYNISDEITEDPEAINEVLIKCEVLPDEVVKEEIAADFEYVEEDADEIFGNESSTNEAESADGDDEETKKPVEIRSKRRAAQVAAARFSTPKRVKKGKAEPNKPKTVLTEDELELMRSLAEMKCEICSEELTTWIDTLAHFNRMHKIHGFIRCCGKKLCRAYEMRDHLMWHKDPNAFACKTCSKQLVSRDNLALHESIHLPEEERIFTCELCGKKFGNSFYLHLHKKKHERDQLEPTIACEKCPGRLYKTLVDLNSHIYTSHRDSKFICHICSTELKSRGSLNIHVRNHLDTGKPIECKLCGHFLKNKARFSIHMARHKQIQNGPYPCPQCSKLYKHRHALTSHIAFVHTTRKFPCPTCEKAFKHQSSLDNHQAQHTNIEKFRCPFCEKTFKSNKNIHLHKKKMHPEEYATSHLPSYMIPSEESGAKKDEQ